MIVAVVNLASQVVDPAGANRAESALFWILAAACLLSAIGVLVARDIVRAAMCLFGTLASVAGLYFLLAAYFVGAIQLVVYAGGTLLLIIFGIMLTARRAWGLFRARPAEVAAGVVACGVLLAGLVRILVTTAWPSSGAGLPDSRVAGLGRELLTTYLGPFEAVSVLLLVAMLGAAYLARPERPRRPGQP